jgi:hypothetical protein
LIFTKQFDPGLVELKYIAPPYDTALLLQTQLLKLQSVILKVISPLNKRPPKYKYKYKNNNNNKSTSRTTTVNSVK